jgi:hypothetical protein
MGMRVTRERRSLYGGATRQLHGIGVVAQPPFIPLIAMLRTK